ncbi:hypothetical protein [Thermus albus]|uniref:hypothetical protein n=1 Tax=Thermus albus TaxID=2908146 RepID=UPI001FAABB5F|nr:hypothetical protein [Thermus albus]
MYLIYRGPYPERIFTHLDEVPEGVKVWYAPEEDLLVPVVRIGDRLLYLEPDGVYRYFVPYESPQEFTLPQGVGDALTVFYDPDGPRFGLELYLGQKLVAQEVLHEGPLALEALRSVFGKRGEE